MRTLRCNRIAALRPLLSCTVQPRAITRPAFDHVAPYPIQRERVTPPHRAWSSTAACASKNTEPTIYALSTAPGKAAIAIIRISGVACADIYFKLCPGKRLPSPRYASVRSLISPIAADGGSTPSVLDAGALVLYFPAPKTATGEDVLELHVHGGVAVVKAVLAAVEKCDTPAKPVRYAEPGEFTRRAFLNDRIDLTQVEALAETLSAVTEEQRRISVQGTTGVLSARYELWRSLLLHARSELEALIDFSEDQHFDESPTSLASSVAMQVKYLEKRISYHSANAIRGELLRSGISVSLIGAPNAGKSSLLNLIVGRNAAIVSKEAGTTRDIIEAGLDLGGFFCRLGDTAGLRKFSSLQRRDNSPGRANVIGEVEKEGIRRAKERASQSDLVILVLSIEPSIQDQGAQLLLDPEVLNTATQLIDDDTPLVIAINKMDNYGPYTDAGSVTARLIRAVQTVLPAVDASRIFCLSCQEAEDAYNRQAIEAKDMPAQPDAVTDPGNLQAFLAGLTNTFRSLTSPLIPPGGNIVEGEIDGDENIAMTDPSIWQESLGTNQRQRALLDQCAVHLRGFLAQTNLADAAGKGTVLDANAPPREEIDIVTASESLRAAAECLGKITGRGDAGDVEEVLGVVFEKFCVGK